MNMVSPVPCKIMIHSSRSCSYNAVHCGTWVDVEVKMAVNVRQRKEPAVGRP